MYNNCDIITPEVDRSSDQIENEQKSCAKLRLVSFHLHQLQMLINVNALAPIRVNSSQYVTNQAAMYYFNRIKIFCILLEILHYHINQLNIVIIKLFFTF